MTGGCPLTAGLVGRWNFDYLSAPQGLGAETLINVHMAPRAVRRFARFYGHGLGKGAVSGMPFRTFAETSSANEAQPVPPWRYYAQAQLLRAAAADSAADASSVLHTPCGPLHRQVRVGESLADDLSSRIDWRWLSDALSTVECRGIHGVSLWAGVGPGFAPRTHRRESTT